MSEWISVDDRLPEHSQSVKTKSADGRVFDCEFWSWNGHGRFKLKGKVWEHGSVTHWQPQPSGAG